MLKNIFILVTSIQCIGKQTALFIIAYSEGFTKIKTWHQFASYCGTAPFPNSSGTSLRGNTKVSHLANKKIKSLLDLCAKVAIQYNPEMKDFERDNHVATLLVKKSLRKRTVRTTEAIS